MTWIINTYGSNIPKSSLKISYTGCRISKRKALWLLENGVIPCEDSGKKTRRFRIKPEDVIDFLERRDAGDLDVILPQGIFSSVSHPVCWPRTYLDSEELCTFILTEWDGQPDMLTVKEAAELCGYSAHTVSGWLRKGSVASIAYHGANLVSKDSLAKWLASREGQGIGHMSEVHRGLLERFRILQAGQYIFSVENRDRLCLRNAQPVSAWRSGWDSNPRTGLTVKRFRVVLVMTTSIPLHIRFSPPGRKIALQIFVSVLLAFAQNPLSG